MKAHSVKSLIFLAALALFLPMTAHGVDASKLWQGGYWGPLITCTGDYARLTTSGGAGALQTCTSLCNFAELIQAWILFFYSIILYILVPIGVASGGFLYLISAGNTERVDKAKTILKKTFMGLAWASLIWVILSLVASTIGAGGSGITWPDITCNASAPINVNITP